MSATSSAQQDRDVNAKGKIVGFDMLYLTFNPKTGTGTANVVVAAKGGLLYGALRLNASSIAGKVTGGTGKFRGAAGPISARNLSRSGTRTP